MTDSGGEPLSILYSHKYLHVEGSSRNGEEMSSQECQTLLGMNKTSSVLVETQRLVCLFIKQTLARHLLWLVLCWAPGISIGKEFEGTRQCTEEHKLGSSWSQQTDESELRTLWFTWTDEIRLPRGWKRFPGEGHIPKLFSASQEMSLSGQGQNPKTEMTSQAW